MDKSDRNDVRARVVADATSSGITVDLVVITELDDCPTEELRRGFDAGTLEALDLVAFWLHGDLDAVRSIEKGLDGESLCAAVAGLAQELMCEELAARGMSNWPACPKHPARHPLLATIGGRDRAVWMCPSGEYAIGIGELATARRM